MWERYCCLTSFFRLLIRALVVKIQPRHSCTMLRRCQIYGDFCVLYFSASCLQHISDMHSEFTLRPHHVWKYGRHPICGIGQTIIFSSCGFFYYFFPRLISAAVDRMSAILLHMVWRYCELRMQVWNVLQAARWKIQDAKIAINLTSAQHRTTVSGLYLHN